jgi:hypothetical protein
VHGLFGKITLKRAYYVAGEGRTHSPLDSQLSIRGHTPGLQYFLTLFTGQMFSPDLPTRGAGAAIDA